MLFCSSPGGAGEASAPHPRDPLSVPFGGPASGPPFADIDERLRPSEPNRSAAGTEEGVGWQPGFGLPVPDNAINALLPYGNLLIAAGSFRRIGDLIAPGIATWDGSRWSPLGAFPGGYARELAVQGSDVLALDGGSDVWRWDGSAWATLGPYPIYPDYATDMTVDGDRVAVALTTFQAEGWRSVVVLHAQGAWTILGDMFAGSTPERQGIVWALAWYRNELYAGGDFEKVGDAPCRHMARWDGSRWQQVGGGLGVRPYDFVRELAAFGDELVASGSIQLDLESPGRVLARWNGSVWSEFPYPESSFPSVARLRAVGSDLYALGHSVTWPERGPSIARWDGAEWHLGEDLFRDWVYDVATYDGRLHAGGALSVEGLGPATPLMRRDGGVWDVPLAPGAMMRGFLGSSGPSVNALLATDQGIVAGGWFDFTGTAGGWRPSSGLARWDGAEWNPMGLESMTESRVTDIALHEGKVHAVGSFAGAAGYFRVIRLDGVGWQPVGNPPLLNINCIASALGDLFIGGLALDGSGGILRWDGSLWQKVGGGLAQDVSSQIHAIAESGGDVVVGGLFDRIGGVPARNIAAWNPAAGWRALGEGLDGRVIDLLSRNGVLYASGLFRKAGGVTVEGIARWKDGAWSALPPQYEGQILRSPWVTALGWYHGQLVASGTVRGALAALGPDNQWHPFSGRAMPVDAMVESGPSLFVGGSFSQMGGLPSYGIAEWREPAPTPVALASGVVAAPNPSAADVHVRYQLSAGATVRVDVFDLFGRLVERPFEGWQSAGSQDVVWRPAAARARPGVYFARVRVGNRSEVVRVMRVDPR